MSPLVVPAVTTGIGLLGSLFGGGNDQQQIENSTTTTSGELSPEQQQLLQMLREKLGDEFDLTDIINSMRERIGNESSALRISAMQRLQRSGAPALQQQSALADITTRGLRELGGGIADLEFQGMQANAAQDMNIFRILGSLLQGTGTQTATTSGTTTARGQSGQGFAQLFGAGLQGLMQPGVFGNKKRNTSDFGVDIYNPDLYRGTV